MREAYSFVKMPEEKEQSTKVKLQIKYTDKETKYKQHEAMEISSDDETINELIEDINNLDSNEITKETKITIICRSKEEFEQTFRDVTRIKNGFRVG